jgi:5'-nucleotidase
MQHPGPPDWSCIDTVLLDLDGTLLDLAFDNHFWLELVPQAYAACHGVDPAQARALLGASFRAREGTLEWYCVDHWSRELGLDILALKRANAAGIRWLPGARHCLERLRERGKRLVLLTNCHPRVIELKDEHTGVGALMDAVLSSHRFGMPKESARFWELVREVEPFDAQRSVFVDDNPAVLRTARTAGVRWIFGVRCPDSRAAPRTHSGVATIDSVAELIA